MSLEQETQLRISRKEYSTLIAIALQAKKMLEYEDEDPIFSFMVDSYKKSIKESLKDESLPNIF
tara:strand:+ start:126 stop:317 length:192 start_codon:yes stop_codon:yes gene_type:complete